MHLRFAHDGEEILDASASFDGRVGALVLESVVIELFSVRLVIVPGDTDLRPVFQLWQIQPEMFAEE